MCAHMCKRVQANHNHGSPVLVSLTIMCTHVHACADMLPAGIPLDPPWSSVSGPKSFQNHCKNQVLWAEIQERKP